MPGKLKSLAPLSGKGRLPSSSDPFAKAPMLSPVKSKKRASGTLNVTRLAVKYATSVLCVEYITDFGVTKLHDIDLTPIMKQQGGMEKDVPAVRAALRASTREAPYLAEVSDSQIDRLLIKGLQGLLAHEKKTKAALDEDFQKNLSKPGDADYQYDKRVDHTPAVGNKGEWDSTSSDEEEIAMEIDTFE
jgi:hypothetical protein